MISRDPTTTTTSLEQALRIPYELDISTRIGGDGHWVCRLEYPELNGCYAENRCVLTALDEVEAKRKAYLEAALLSPSGLQPPRPPLRS